MPELPEVETIVKELKEDAVNKRFWNFDVKNVNTVKPKPETLKKIIGLRILDVYRRGKYIVMKLDRDMFVVVHLRMTGRLMWKKVRGKEKFIRVTFDFSDATRLMFSDVRKFGKVYVGSKKEIDLISGMAKLGLEPISKDFTAENLYKKLKNKKFVLKNMLLRQDIIAGIGNIYADEIAFGLKLHPKKIIKNVPQKFCEKLREVTVKALEAGIKNCGVSMSDFVGTRGDLGRHKNYLKVYGRSGLKCYECGTEIKKIRVVQRGTNFCPKCQKL